MIIERKKNAREIFWQNRLNTLHPNGTNKTMGKISELNIPLQSTQHINNLHTFCSKTRISPVEGRKTKFLFHDRVHSCG